MVWLGRQRCLLSQDLADGPQRAQLQLVGHGGVELPTSASQTSVNGASRTDTYDKPELSSRRSVSRCSRASGTSSSTGVTGMLAKTNRPTPASAAREISSA